MIDNRPRVVSPDDGLSDADDQARDGHDGLLRGIVFGLFFSIPVFAAVVAGGHFVGGWW